VCSIGQSGGGIALLGVTEQQGRLLLPAAHLSRLSGRHMLEKMWDCDPLHDIRIWIGEMAREDRQAGEGGLHLDGQSSLDPESVGPCSACVIAANRWVLPAMANDSNQRLAVVGHPAA
jgi:hypothetical protein